MRFLGPSKRELAAEAEVVSLREELEATRRDSEYLDAFQAEKRRLIMEGDDMGSVHEEAAEIVTAQLDEAIRREITGVLLAQTLLHTDDLHIMYETQRTPDLVEQAAAAARGDRFVVSAQSLDIAIGDTPSYDRVVNGSSYTSAMIVNEVVRSSAVPFGMLDEGDHLHLGFAQNGAVRTHGSKDDSGLISLSTNDFGRREVSLQLLNPKTGLAFIANDSFGNDDSPPADRELALQENALAIVGTTARFDMHGDAVLLPAFTREADVGFVQANGVRWPDEELELFWVQRANEDLM